MLSAGLNLIMSALKGQPSVDSAGFGGSFGANAGTFEGFGQAFSAAEAMTSEAAGPLTPGAPLPETLAEATQSLDGAVLPPGGDDLPWIAPTTPLADPEASLDSAPAPSLNPEPVNPGQGLPAADPLLTIPAQANASPARIDDTSVAPNDRALPSSRRPLGQALPTPVSGEVGAQPVAKPQPAVAANPAMAGSQLSAVDDTVVGTTALTRGDDREATSNIDNGRPLSGPSRAEVADSLPGRLTSAVAEKTASQSVLPRAAAGSIAIPAAPRSPVADTLLAQDTVRGADPRLTGQSTADLAKRNPGLVNAVSTTAPSAASAAPNTAASGLTAGGAPQQQGSSGSQDGLGFNRSALETARLAARHLSEASLPSRGPAAEPDSPSERAILAAQLSDRAARPVDPLRTDAQAPTALTAELDPETQLSPVERKDLLRSLQLQLRSPAGGSVTPAEGSDPESDALASLVRRLTAADAGLESADGRPRTTAFSADAGRTSPAATHNNGVIPAAVQGESVPVREAALLADAFASVENTTPDTDAPDSGRAAAPRVAEGGAVHSQPAGAAVLSAATASRPGSAPSASAMAFNESLVAAPDSPDFPEELMGQVRMAKMTGQQEVRLNLHPAELGRLTITINSEGDSARVNFLVDNQQARDALESNLPRLRDLFEQSGLQLDDANVSDQQYGTGGEGEEQAFTGERELAGARNDEETPGVDATVSHPSDRAGLLDAYA